MIHPGLTRRGARDRPRCAAVGGEGNSSSARRDQMLAPGHRKPNRYRWAPLRGANRRPHTSDLRVRSPAASYELLIRPVGSQLSGARGRAAPMSPLQSGEAGQVDHESNRAGESFVRVRAPVATASVSLDSCSLVGGRK